MSKGKALGSAITCTLICILFLFTPLIGFIPMFLLAALFFWIVWLFKYSRDAKIVAASQVEYAEEAKQLPLPPTMTSKGSHRLFIPGSLDEQR